MRTRRNRRTPLRSSSHAGLSVGHGSRRRCRRGENCGTKQKPESCPQPFMAERLIIEAGKAERHYWHDLWRYRELFYFLSWRDILVRYKQTVIGVLWAILRPILTTVVFVFV